jgi:hypothetical protein
VSKHAWKSVGLCLTLGAGLFASMSVAAQESVCARVKIEIKQELTLERQAFDAEMRITNSLPTTALTEVDIDVKVIDELGAPAEVTTDPNNLNADFFIRVSSKQGIDSIDGAGQVAGGSTATINWLLIPAPGAAGNTPLGKRYLVGATLRYRFGSELQQMELNPDAITVMPLPQLTMDYFLTRDVIADDPFTAEIEAPEPYTLGVRVKNTGMAAAKSLKIESAQPKIVENNQGLPINFLITGSYVQDLPAGNSLLVNFGDIPASSSKMGRWLMESNLAGRFEEFTATFTHSDELGGALTSVLQATNAHLLLRDVRVDLPGRDVVRDFLAIDGSALKVYESAGPDNDVTDRSAEATLAAANGGYRLTLPASQGFIYVRKPDPYQGQKLLGPIMRADAKAMAMENVWLSKTKNAETKQWEYWFNVFDVNSPGVYDVAFREQSTEPKPPVLQFIPDRVVKEKEQIGFVVEASSNPTGRPVTLSAEPLPTGATFVSQSPGVSYFDWTPAEGQAGEYIINYLARDGNLTATRSAKIRVESTTPPPGPSTPTVIAPLTGTEVTTLRPQLQVLTSAASNDPTQSVVFELYADPGMTVPLGTSQTVAKNTTPGAPTTWQQPEDLNDNRHYYWRARAVAADGIYSDWANSSFMTNLVNDAPDSFNLTAPGPGLEVDTLTPTLSLTNAQDRDGDAITYRFEVYTDETLSELHESVSGIAPDASGTTSWTVTAPMTNHGTYYWHAIAIDEHGLATDTPIRSFTVNTGNHAPEVRLNNPEVSGTTGRVVLSAVRSDGDGDELTMWIELDTVSSFDSSNRRTSGPMSSATAWPVAGLSEDQQYFWRAKVSDGRAESEWVTAQFFFDQVNSPPTTPTLGNPSDGSLVFVRSPIFEVYPSTDPENDPIRYEYEVNWCDYQNQIWEAQGISSSSSWQLDYELYSEYHELKSGVTYCWRVRALDIHDASSAWSAESRFTTASEDSLRPFITMLSPSGVVDARDVGGEINIAWTGSDSNAQPTVALYYDSAGSGYAGTKIVDGLLQEIGRHQGSYAWNLSGVAPGAYHVYGIIYDRYGASSHYAPGTVVVPANPQQGTVSLTAASGMNLREGIDSATVQVALSRTPVADVVLPIGSSDISEATTSVQQLKFTPTNWATPQSVSVTARTDGVTDGDQPFSINVGKAMSTDPNYIGVMTAPLTGVVRDMDAMGAGLAVTNYLLFSKTFDKKMRMWVYQYKIVLTNNGPLRYAVSASITNAPGFEVVQGQIFFESIGQDESITSTNVIELRSASDIGTSLPSLQWSFRHAPSIEEP